MESYFHPQYGMEDSKITLEPPQEAVNVAAAAAAAVVVATEVAVVVVVSAATMLSLVTRNRLIHSPRGKHTTSFL